MLLLPEQAGYPIGGGDSGPEYLMLEIHFDNPEQESGLHVKNHVEIFHTTEIR